MTSRIKGFDGLRAIAVTLVFMEHKVIEGWPFGALGVKLFFVLSGYLIVSILHGQRARVEAGGSAWRELGEFWKRRALRIFPIYALVLSVITALMAWGYMQPAGIGWYWAMAGNYYLWGQAVAHGTIPWGHFGHLWSVAVENQFYALAGLALLFSPRRWHVTILASLFVLSVLWIAAVLAQSQPIGVVLPLNNFAFMAGGGLIPLWWEKRARPNTLLAAILACVTLLTISQAKHALGLAPTTSYVAETLLELVFSLALIAHVAKWQAGAVTRALEFGMLQRLGVISYGFYLYHMFAPYLIDVTRLLGLPEPSHTRNLLWMPVQFALTVIVSELSWRWIEQPLLALKSARREPTRATVAA